MGDWIERDRTEQDLRDRTRQLQAITEAMTVFLDRGDWGRASEALLRGCFDLTGSEYGFVGVVVEGPALRVLAHAGIVWDAHENRAFYEQALRTYREVGYLEFRNFDTLFGAVLTQGRPLIANAPDRHPQARGVPSGHPPLRAFLGVPFLWGEEVVGMIAVANRSGGYAEREQAHLEGLAGAAGVLYDSYRRNQREVVLEDERRRNEATLRETNRRLEEALEQLRATQEKIVRQERLRALGLMASGVAHDFNNTLQPILGFSDLLLRDPQARSDPEEVRECLEMIRTAAVDASGVVNRLMEFYRPRARTELLEAADLNRLVEQAVRLTQPRWRDESLGDGIHIRVEMRREPIPTLRLRESEIREMLTNLIFNAVDAMPGGGTIELATHRDGDRVVVEVRDDGVGMSEEERSRCLEPFFTTKGALRTGMGLATVYGIAERHGGEIEIESKPGQGTCFRIRFLISAETEASEAPLEREDPEPGSPLRVLLIDDDPLVRRTLTRLLASEGHRVEVAASGPAGLDWLDRMPFDLVLTDQAMPGMTGREVATAIKARRPHVPVVLLTGFGEFWKASEESASDVDLVVSKPVQRLALRKAFGQLHALRPG